MTFDSHRARADIVKVAEGSDNGSQPASVPALPRPASPVPDTFGHAAGVGTPEIPHAPTPRYGPAVLRALARWDAADHAFEAANGTATSELHAEKCRALIALRKALAAERAAAVPALPDEGERDASPHRFAHPHGGPL